MGLIWRLNELILKYTDAVWHIVHWKVFFQGSFKNPGSQLYSVHKENSKKIAHPSPGDPSNRKNQA